MRDVRWAAWERWQAAAGPWRGWSVCLPLMAPRAARQPSGLGTTRHVGGEATHLTDELAPTLSTGGTAVLVDLEPTLGVWLAAELNWRGLAHAVLVLPRWPHGEAVLPTGELTEALIATARRLGRSDHAPNVVFVLDADRNQTIARPRRASDERADNRYQLSASDLPNLSALRRAGITRLVKVTAV